MTISKNLKKLVRCVVYFNTAFNLVNKIDLEHTQTRLSQYEALNKSLITQQQQQRDQESLHQQQLDDAAKQERILRAQKVKEERELEQREREADKKEMVSELAKGRDIDDIMLELQKRREERVKAAKQRESAELLRQKHYEEQLNVTPRTLNKTKLSPAEIELIQHVVSSDFRGPFATIHDGSSLSSVRAPPSILGGSATMEGYVDPWLRPELISKGAVLQQRAGGYDWQHQVWQRGLCAISDSLALLPAESLSN